jgi:hypothetical protein
LRERRTTTTIVCATLAGLLSASTARAADPVLIAIGTVSGTYEDFATQTAAPLENGIAGNRLGGIGSGLAYAGGDLFIALPDRGPNAQPYNPLVDDTASYINRFQTFHLSLAPSGDPNLPFTLTPMLIRTTLLSSVFPLVYSTGTAFGLPGGAPALNHINHTFYFTGRSDNFDPSRSSTNPWDARFDTEGVRVSNDGESVFITDEYGPYVYQFDRATGIRTGVYTLPAKFAIHALSAMGNTEISGNTTGRVANKGMEGLAITPDGKTLVGIMQSPLLQDGGTDTGLTTRIVTIDIRSGAMREFAYPLDTVKTTVSEILAVNNHEFLVDERDSKGLGDNSTAVIKKIYKIDLAGAKDVSAISGGPNLAAKAVTKTLFLDVVLALGAKGIQPFDVPAKLEGITFGQDVVINGETKHTLYIANDNDYSAVVANSHHTGGLADNPNKFFVFAFDDDDLPGFVPQQFRRTHDRDDRDRDDHDRDDHDRGWDDRGR